MYKQILSELSSDNAALEAQLLLAPDSAENIDSYRRKKHALLNRITALCDSGAAQEDGLLPIWKTGAEIAADIVRTRIIHTSGDGFQRTEPYPVSSGLRSSCKESFDTLIGQIRAYDRMYMAPVFEKTAPGKDKRLAAMRLYDMQQQQARSETQSANKSINRLFGSRG